MIKSARYLFVVVFAGISFFFVGAVSAAFDAYLEKSGTVTDQQSTMDFSWGSTVMGVNENSYEILESVADPQDLSKGDKPPPKIEAGDIFRPGGTSTPQQKNLPRGQRGIGGVIPPDFDDDATSR